MYGASQQTIRADFSTVGQSAILLGSFFRPPIAGAASRPDYGRKRCCHESEAYNEAKAGSSMEDQAT